MSQPNSIDPTLVPEQPIDETTTASTTLPESSGPTRKRGFDVYTMMLILSALSLLIGTILLYLDRVSHA